jgi:ribosomal protein S18 acetylase RimI-like enzyme
MQNPLFASTELAARIEAAETDLIRAGAEAFERASGERALLQPLAGGLAVHTRAGSPLNKVVGLGFAGPPAPAELAEVERASAARGAPSVQIELATLAEPGIAELLTRRGYALVGFENVLGRALPAGVEAPRVPRDPSDPRDVQVERGTERDLEPWIATVTTGFATPDTQGVASHESFPRELLETVLREMASARGCVRYLAYRSGKLAGGASMRLIGGVAQLTGAATLPEHRRRGVQSALLAQRLTIAAEQGCDVAVVTTQPGSKSQENVQKLGFHLLYTRAILVRELEAGSRR